MTELDPRHIVTQTAFTVEPGLLGRPLAGPGRRVLAMGVDLALAGMMSLAGLWGALALFAAAALGRLASRRAAQGLRGTARAFTAAGAVVLCVGLVYGCASRDDDDDGPAEAAAATVDGDSMAAAVLRDLEGELEGVDTEQMLGYLPAAMREGVRARLVPGADAPLPPDVRTAHAALLEAYAAAYAAADSAALDTLGGDAAEIVAGARLAALRGLADRRADRIDDLEDEVEALQERVAHPSFLHALQALLADLGLRAGWLGLYFTVFLYWTQGYTPGKRLLGLRVQRLDGRAITLWHAFERFGGYAAGLATGLLGFAQVLWDANRQGVQDKIAGTVVVRRDRG